MQTVNGYLSKMCTDLYVNGDEIQHIRTSINTISERIDLYFGNPNRCIHEVIKKKIFGSYDRDTIISRKYDDSSDVDYLIVFEDSKNYTPQTCLNWLRGFAELWYPSSIVKQSSPTIVIELQNIKFELVPSYMDSMGKIYIPKDDKTWQTTNVDNLSNDMITVNKKYNYVFKNAIRIIKYWNIKKNLKKYKSYQLEEYLTNKFMYSSAHCETLLAMLDWMFFYLSQYTYIDEYVTDRINKAMSLIEEAKRFDQYGYHERAIETIKKILPET